MDTTISKTTDYRVCSHEMGNHAMFLDFLLFISKFTDLHSLTTTIACTLYLSMMHNSFYHAHSNICIKRQSVST